MGTSSSSQQRQIVTHSRLGNVQISLLQTNQQPTPTFIMTKTLPNPEPITHWLSSLREIMPLYKNVTKSTKKQQKIIYFNFHQASETLKIQLLFLPISYSWKQERLCGEGGVLKVEYEAIMYDLQSQILNRRQQGKYFLQTQLWFLLYKLLKLLTQFAQINKRIGNLHSKNILLDEDGQIKVITKYSLIEEMDSFQQKLCDIHASAFLAPEQITNFNRTQTQSNNQKAEIYSLGMTILAAGTLSQGDQFYKVHLGSDQVLSVDQNQINTKLHSFHEHYSSFLWSFVQNLLQPNPNERKNVFQLYDNLKQYDSDILELHPFLPNQQIQQRKLNQSNKGKILTMSGNLSPEIQTKLNSVLKSNK